jgi:membrane protein YdbS with pleckstrin-like domain
VARSRRGRRLGPDEQVVVEVRPHWWLLAGPVVWTSVVIAGALTSVAMSPPVAVKWLVLVVLVVSVVWLVQRYVRWYSTSLVVTTSRLMEKRGVLRRRIREIPIGSIADLGYRQTFLERVIGAGDVTIESAGTHGEEVFPDLPHPESIHNEIYLQLERWRRPGDRQGPSIPEQIDQLDRLRQRGVISNSEFEAKKSQLLDRL